MKIQPLKNEVQIMINEARAGSLSMESVQTAVEVGEVVAIGSGVEGIKVGDRVIFKSWAVDICSMDGKKYYFINMTTNGIKAILK